jgi:glycosyltransferase involved in cell wall biosynthesis
MSEPTASVILSTYNQPAWLEKVLHGYAAQDRRDFEVLVADDGSAAETRACIDSLRPRLPFALQHVWQPDEGFRKCRILNRAIAASRGDYLIFSDGDCIPRADFVSAHLGLRRRRRFLSGGYIKLPRALSDRIDCDDIGSGDCFDLSWLRGGGLSSAPRHLKLAVGPRVATLLDAVVTTRASWNGHNASGWRSDLVAANGFDERMGYGGEDRELGERLENAGVIGLRIRHRAVVLHLDHARGYVRDDVLAANAAIRAETRRLRRVATEHGLQAQAAVA